MKNKKTFSKKAKLNKKKSRKYYPKSKAGDPLENMVFGRGGIRQ